MIHCLGIWDEGVHFAIDVIRDSTQCLAEAGLGHLDDRVQMWHSLFLLPCSKNFLFSPYPAVSCVLQYSPPLVASVPSGDRKGFNEGA